MPETGIFSAFPRHNTSHILANLVGELMKNLISYCVFSTKEGF